MSVVSKSAWRVVVVLGLTLEFAVANAVWLPASGEQVQAALSERSLQFGLSRQTFYASGRTLYDAGSPSWGRWRVQGDLYCSQWPPQSTWRCYAIALHVDGTKVRFTADGDDVSTGVYVE